MSGARFPFADTLQVFADTTPTMPAGLIGHQFGRLLVIKPAAGEKSRSHYECLCECGAKTTASKYKLLSGHTKSCGCYGRSLTAQRNAENAKHGMSNTPTYATWRAMVVRCSNPCSSQYASYGGRGIKVCDEWLTFAGFFRGMGEKPDGMSIDRIDNNGHYEPGNCRWATDLEQNQNKRTNKLLSRDGITACAAEWARRAGLSKNGFYDRLKAGLSIGEAITKPNRRGQK